MSPDQLELKLRLPADLLIQAHLAQAMYCKKFHVTMARRRCVEQQLGQVVRTVGGAVRKRPNGPPFCRGGECLQGVGVLLAEGLLAREQCPTCAGCGWVPAERKTTEAVG